MAYEFDSSLMGGAKKSQAGAVKKKTAKGSTTVPKDSLTKLPPAPDKVPARIVYPDASSGAQSTPKSAAASSTPSYRDESGTGASSPAAAAPAAQSAAQQPTFVMPERDEEAARRYGEAREALAALQGQTPVYDSRYDAQIRSLYEQITGRAPFRYDSATDSLYQQYVQDYTTLGQMAMRDTMGRAAALTGGYGSSYAQSVGQQQYDAYLQRLADVLPETYGMALDAYQAAGDELQRRFDTTTGLEKSDYARYLDELGQYNRSLDRAQEDVDRTRSEMLYDEDRAYDYAQDAYARELAQQQTAYARLLKLIAAGYSPSTEELARAGLSGAQGAALVAAAAPAAGRSGSSGSSGGSSTPKKKTAAKGDLNKRGGSVKGR